MPITFVTWIVSTAALCGVPFFSGFFSKDEIIDDAEHNGYKVFFVVGLIGAFMTTAYMTRATYLTFFGAARGAAAGGTALHDDHDASARRARARPTCTHDAHRRRGDPHDARRSTAAHDASHAAARLLVPPHDRRR